MMTFFDWSIWTDVEVLGWALSVGSMFYCVHVFKFNKFFTVHLLKQSKPIQ